MQKNIKKIPQVNETLTYKSIKEAPDTLRKIIEQENKIKEIAEKIKIIAPTNLFYWKRKLIQFRGIRRVAVSPVHENPFSSKNIA